MTKPVRDSNLELLRIIAMMFIVLHHFVVHGYQLAKINSHYFSIFPKRIPLYADILLSANSFLIIGVNLFLLISGYYSIKLKWKSIVNLVVICLFYDYSLLAAASLITGKALTAYWWEPLVYLFTRSGWFITCYFALMLLSPAINKAFDSFTNKEKIYGLAILLLLNWWFGFFIDSQFINQAGYSLMQFIFMYYLGRMMQHFPDYTRIRKRYSFAGYIISSAIAAGIAIYYFNHKDYVSMWKVYHYDNPLVVVSAVMFFVTFKNMTVRNKWINWSASSVLAIYLLHESAFLGQKIYSLIYETIRKHGYLSAYTLGVLLGLFLLIMIAGILIDKIRQRLTQGLISYSSNKLEIRQQKLENSILNKWQSTNK